MKWLICFSNINLMLGSLLFKNLINLIPFQKQPECHQHILNKFQFVKIILI